jgi:hypothetical protein
MCKDGSQSTEYSVAMYDSDMHKDFPFKFLCDFVSSYFYFASANVARGTKRC